MEDYSPTEVLETLQNRPSYDVFCDVLKKLKGDSLESEHLGVKSPSALSAKINDQLIRINVPDFWNIIYNSKAQNSELALLRACLRNIIALRSIYSHLRLLVKILEEKDRRQDGSNHERKLVIYLELLSALLTGDDYVHYFWMSLEESKKKLSNSQLIWTEFVNLVASGKLLATTSQAASFIETSDKTASWVWLATGSSFACWLGLNTAYMTRYTDADDDKKLKAAASFFGKSIMLGYSIETIKPVIGIAIIHKGLDSLKLASLIKNLRPSEQRNFLKSFLHFVSYEGAGENGSWPSAVSKVTPQRRAALSFVAAQILQDNASLKRELVTCLTSTGDIIAENSIFAARVFLSVLSRDMEQMQEIFEKNIKTFGDKLFIKHAPIAHQKALAQVLLLATGYVHRGNPMFVFTIVRSSILTQGISNRLSAASNEARFLGMVVSMAISRLVDKPEVRISFDIDKSKLEEADHYIKLTSVNDQVGTSDDLVLNQYCSSPKTALSSTKHQKQSQTSLLPQSPSKGIINSTRIIEEIEDNGENDDGTENFVPYAKLDSDPEDEEEDPTLVQRDRPKPPIYIRDLLVGLKDDENHDRFKLALEHAAELIQRKLDFGKEVSDHIYDLASVLVGLRDQHEHEKFDELRLNAMIALLKASPERMGPWYCREYYNGNYSLSQRIAILSTVGLGVRQIAGFAEDIFVKGSADPAKDGTSFRRLPEKLHKLYISESSPIEATAKEVERSIVQPVALDAADKLTGPNALKVRTFSSRMDVEKRRKKPIANRLAKIVNDSFFSPFVGLWEAQVRRSGPTNVYLSPTLLPHFVKTLALLIHASGPSTLSLPQMTTELWSLLLSLRTRALEDMPSLEAVLFALLVLLEVNLESGGKQRLVQEHAMELQETQKWTELVFSKFDERLGGEEGSRVKMLAASVLIKLKEVVEWYQGVLFG